MIPAAPPLTDLPQVLQPATTTVWQQLQEALHQAAIAPPEEVQIEWLKVLACSEFATRCLIRQPELLLSLCSSDTQDHSNHAATHRLRLSALLEHCDDITALMRALRQFRHQELTRIAWRDLAGDAPLEQILGELSALADCLINASLDWLYDRLCERYGVPRGPNGQAQQMVVLGMGKLGGQELNFSSDIDLIFTYPSNGETDGTRSLSNAEFFRRLGQQLIKALHEVTADGFVYRVDTRLRPFGDAGPLVISFSAMEEYYQTHGREWERYALIKARVVAGDPRSGQRLLDTLQPFVYRRYLDYGAFESLREMKALIVQDIKRKGLDNNLKLGPGGIREIEFIGQAFQLIYGGREPELRGRQLLPVLDYLAHSGRLPPTATEQLRQAYVFLRRSENRLQLWADQQTHELPREAVAQARLAYAMGYADWPSYVDALNHHLAIVEQQFTEVFSQDDTTGDDDWQSLWNERSNGERLTQLLQDQGFDQPERASHALHALRNSFNCRALGSRGYQRLQQLMPLLLETVVETDYPAQTLERLTQLLEAIVRRSSYLALLLENPAARTQLVQLCAASPWIAHYVTRHPLLLDELLTPANLYRPLDRQRLVRELDQELSRIPTDDQEQQLDVLRHFQQSQILRVAAADIADAMPLMIVSDHLTEIAEVLLEKIVVLAWDDLRTRFGQPQCMIDGASYQPGLVVIGYGKLGGLELGYHSDLDLVFLHDSQGEHQYTDGRRQIDNATFFAKLVQRMTHLLSTRTPAGLLYETDTRLRPSGRSGLLVSSVGAFGHYQQQQAWTWEHQALVRARYIAGSTDIGAQFTRIRRDILCQPRDLDALRHQVSAMRERMRRELDKSHKGGFHIKQGHGGMIDIEFLVQYLVLAHAHRYPELITYSDNIRQIDTLEQVGLLNADTAESLRESYRRLRRRSHRLKLQEQPSVVTDTEFTDERAMVQTLWQHYFHHTA
jgi:glutamate-ammonia-ligase adenylyltransferase